MARRFAVWLSVFDPRTQIPPPLLPSPKGLRAQTHVTLIWLLAATGLRSGDALALDVHDVDPHDGVLKIRKTKFGKSRFVPVEETTRAALARYAERRDELIPRRQADMVLRRFALQLAR